MGQGGQGVHGALLKEVKPRAQGAGEGKGGPGDAIRPALTWKARRGPGGRRPSLATQPGRGMTQQTLRLKPQARPNLGHGPALPAPAGPASHPEVCPRVCPHTRPGSEQLRPDP